MSNQVKAHNIDMWGEMVNIPKGYSQVIPNGKRETKLGDKVLSTGGNWLEVYEDDGKWEHRHSPSPGTPIKYSITIRKTPSILKKVVDASIRGKR